MTSLGLAFTKGDKSNLIEWRCCISCSICHDYLASLSKKLAMFHNTVVYHKRITVFAVYLALRCFP